MSEFQFFATYSLSLQGMNLRLPIRWLWNQTDRKLAGIR
jgi:hypothetical protein